MADFGLSFGFPVPGGVRTAGGWQLSWPGCAVMGIVNVTPDSFSDGGRGAEAALLHARQLLLGGALVLDIGGESTRPGAPAVDAATELDRVRPVIRGLAGSGAVISIDTMKPEVAAAALGAGAHLVNDVSGLRDTRMRAVCAERGAPACIMHMQGEPRTMQLAPHYGDVVTEVFGFLAAQAELALAAGVPGVLLDPGIGFGKTPQHNLALLRALPQLTARPWPVLVGGSRKKFLAALSGEPQGSADSRDAASLALHLHAARAGTAMVRVHDARGHALALRVQAALEGA
ncbi:dihydropteroate synthase [Deinococcus alpinitundrae]|uniref:dihydropteroate synthase n=1 Tax=Deinococcus alpinitundrae TaxID=468913 RepID=UPI001ED8D60E|nr:dihydropteroate synthase [Deinococcus alpinitundrae]